MMRRMPIEMRLSVECAGRAAVAVCGGENGDGGRPGDDRQRDEAHWGPAMSSRADEGGHEYAAPGGGSKPAGCYLPGRIVPLLPVAVVFHDETALVAGSTEVVRWAIVAVLGVQMMTNRSVDVTGAAFVLFCRAACSALSSIATATRREACMALERELHFVSGDRP